MSTTEQHQCDVCGAVFATSNALGGHKSAKHRGAARTTPPRTRSTGGGGSSRDFSAKARIAALQRDAAEPFRLELRDVERQLQKLSDERAELMALRAQLQAVLRRLDPASYGPKAKAQPSSGHAGGVASAEVKQKQRLDTVRAFVEANGDQLTDGFTSSELDRQLKDAGVTPVMSAQTVMTALQALRDEGVVRADRVTRGGGMSYKLVTNGGTDE